jgi:hypothetical protein
MCIPRLDKTILSIVALMLIAGGALTVLTKLNVPQAHQTFFGGNPFAMKRDVIEGTMAWLFAGLALLGIAVQTLALIWEPPDRLHRWPTYAAVATVSAAIVITVLWLLTCAGYAIARRTWLPQAINGQREIFAMTEMLLRNDGLEDRMLALPGDDPQLPILREGGRERLRTYIDQMEQLFDVVDRTASLDERLARIRVYFDQPVAR